MTLTEFLNHPNKQSLKVGEDDVLLQPNEVIKKYPIKPLNEITALTFVYVPGVASLNPSNPMSGNYVQINNNKRLYSINYEVGLPAAETIFVLNDKI